MYRCIAYIKLKPEVRLTFSTAGTTSRQTWWYRRHVFCWGWRRRTEITKSIIHHYTQDWSFILLHCGSAFQYLMLHVCPFVRAYTYKTTIDEWKHSHRTVTPTIIVMNNNNVKLFNCHWIRHSSVTAKPFYPVQENANDTRISLKLNLYS